MPNYLSQILFMTSWGCSNYQQAVDDFNIFKISKWGLTASVIRILTFNHHPGLIRKFCSKLRHHALKLIFSGRNFKSLQGPDVILSWHDPKLDYHCQFTVRPGPLLYENNDQRNFQNSSYRMNKSRSIKKRTYRFLICLEIWRLCFSKNSETVNLMRLIICLELFS